MLYLLPNLLAECEEHALYLPASVDAAVAKLTHLIAENEKEGRRFLRRFLYPAPKTWRDIQMHLLNEHTTPADKEALALQISRGGEWGMVSDCGMPCLADPGADVVLKARARGVEVTTFAGPSSLLMALVLSGLGAQRFTFHGYLPREEPALIAKLHALESASHKEDATHLWIETPYRNQRLFQIALNSLHDSTYLCVACNLTQADEVVQTRRIREWKSAPVISLDKRPCVFLMHSSIQDSFKSACR